MRIDTNDLAGNFWRVRAGKESRHSVQDRISPSLFQYDYLTIRALSRDVADCIAMLPNAHSTGRALDVGAARSPYRRLLESRGYAVETLDVTTEHGADYVGTAEETSLPDASFDVVLCTQVLEHTRDPWQAMREMHRILASGGYLIASTPHVWFYHPHPADCWRFTQEGVSELCMRGDLELLELRSQGGSARTVFQIGNFLLYGLLGRSGAPLYALANVLGLAADAIFKNDLFCVNFAWLARKT